MGSWAILLANFGEDLSKAMVLRQASPLYGCFVPVSMGAVIRNETSLIIASVARITAAQLL
jgi:hypothetical protein